MKIVDHKLCKVDGTPYPFVASPNHGGELRPEYLVIHYTASSEARHAINWLANPEARASAHLVIGRDGTITQLVPFDRVAWHAGRSRWEGRTGLNRYALGIELDNAGRLVRHGDRWRAWFGRDYGAEEVLEAVHKNETESAGWHVFTAEQLEAALGVSLALMRHYELKDVVGHDDIAPGRKTDPGPAFPMPSFRARLLGRLDETPVPYETTHTVNIRTGPGTRYATVPGGPLPPRTKVEVLAQKGIWHQVDVLSEVNGTMDLQGWVHGRYLARTEGEPGLET